MSTWSVCEVMVIGLRSHGEQVDPQETQVFLFS